MPIDKLQVAAIEKSKQSVTWFLTNFGKLKHPSAGILPFQPFAYQKEAIKAFRRHRFNIFRKCRQAGVSKISGAFATWFAMFHSHKTILIVSRTNDDAMGFLRENVVFLFENLPQWMQTLWRPSKQNEHEIVFPNGSKIKSLTSHPDVLRSNASSLNIIDEAAFIQGMDVMWAAGYPCTRYDTLIQTTEGLLKVGDIAKNGDPWSDIDLDVSTDDGIKKANKSYSSGLTPTKIINTYLGVELEGTHHHRVRAVDETGDYIWRRLDEIKPGDYIISMPGQFRGKRRYLTDGTELTPQLAEILGLYIGDGSFSPKRPKRFKIHFDPQDKDTRDKIVESFNGLGLSLSTRAYPESQSTTENLRLNSSEFAKLMVDNGLNSKTKPQDAEIPPLILQSDEEVLCAFIRGLFDSDGHCYPSSTSLRLGFSSTSEVLCRQVQVALHSLGILSRLKCMRGTHKNRFSSQPYWILGIWDAQSKIKFKDKIGFITKRKQQPLDELVSDNSVAYIDHPALVGEFINDVLDAMVTTTFRQCNDVRKWNLYRIKKTLRIRVDLIHKLSDEFNIKNRLSDYIKKGLHFDKVEMVRDGEAETFDISVPDNNTYLANGIINHNTLQHGGNVIVISTTSGVGNWYWATMTDAEAGLNQFNPIVINWYDMDWAIEYQDPLSRKWMRIAPRDKIRECISAAEIEKYGPYWSPWLEEQYSALQEQGEAWKFEQEILGSFVGSGHTVLSKTVLSHISTTAVDPSATEGMRVTGFQTYTHPVTGEIEEINFDFTEPEEGLWIWKKPILGSPDVKRGDIVIKPGAPAHSYVMGVDISTGKGRDYSAIVVFDVNTMEQVAEFMARCLPRELIKYIDRIGRYYNSALAIIERNNGGDILIDQLRHDLMYPRLWRQKEINDKPRSGALRRQRMPKYKSYGWNTTAASKPTLNKFLIDYIRDKPDEGYTIYSKRLLKQFQTYVRKRDRGGHDTGKTEAEEGAGNYDDLVMACALALRGIADSGDSDMGNLVPTGSGFLNNDMGISLDISQVADKMGNNFLLPMSSIMDDDPILNAQRELENFASSLGAMPISQERGIVTPPKNIFRY
jgi:intein/homing endonuclease